MKRIALVFIAAFLLVGSARSAELVDESGTMAPATPRTIVPGTPVARIEIFRGVNRDFVNVSLLK